MITHMSVSSILILAVMLDHWLGEPTRYHPLALFGKLANFIESRLLFPGLSAAAQMATGCLALLIAVVPLVYLLSFFLQLPILNLLLPPLVLYFCIAAHSLKQHAEAVLFCLRQHDLDKARLMVARMVSRETGHMNEQEIRNAAIESVLENGADAVFAPLFWFVVAGPAGALLYRLCNTLDAMWGYKTSRYLHFGRAAARVDDVLNWLPARLTALSYALLGQTMLALRCWRQQAAALDSPNAGPVMTAGAGALNIRLGGPAYYYGELKNKIHFGSGTVTENHDISRAGRLINHTLLLWILILVIGDMLA